MGHYDNPESAHSKIILELYWLYGKLQVRKEDADGRHRATHGR